MLDVKKIRLDFPMLEESMSGSPLIFLDNSATALKPLSVVNEMVNYYTKFSTNSGDRGSYELSYKVNLKIEQTRSLVGKFINCDSKEVIFTSGTTESLNLVATSFSRAFLKAGDEVILNHAEHSSSVLPWYEVSRILGVKIVFAPLDETGNLTLESIKSVVTKNTKVIAFAHVTNTLADLRDANAICEFATQNNIFTVIDGAQSTPHHKVDVKDINCDFFVFSGHKMCGPTGIGVCYGKYELLEQMGPFHQGGGMNAKFEDDVSVTYKSVPTRFEAGTPNISGIFGLGAAIEYLENVGMENIEKYEYELKRYAIDKMSSLSNVKIYNENTKAGVVIFNVLDDSSENKYIFSQDVGGYLNTFGIALRDGDHCAKLLHHVIDSTFTCRASFYFYNTKEEIDSFVDALSGCSLDSVLLF